MKYIQTCNSHQPFWTGEEKETFKELSGKRLTGKARFGGFLGIPQNKWRPRTGKSM